MIRVHKVGEFYFEYWLEEGERLLVQRLLGLPARQPVIMIVTIIHKGLDSEDLHAKFTEDTARDGDDTADLFECADPDHI